MAIIDGHTVPHYLSSVDSLIVTDALSAPLQLLQAHSMSVQRTLYKQLLAAVRRAAQQGLPCTGCVGLPQAAHILCPATYLSRAFRSDPGLGLNDAFHALRLLPRQMAVLRASDEDTRQALAQWQQLQQHWCGQGALASAQQLEAAEAAAWLLQRLTTQQATQQLLLEEDVEQLQQQSEDAITQARQRLDELAQAVRQAAPNAFGQATAADEGSEQRKQQLQALAEVLFQQPATRLRCDPFEWVYDGLAPLLLPQVLERRKGMPLSLALAAAGVGRRLGMRLALVCADDTQLPGTAEGPLLPQHMPAELAARHAGRTLASAPAPDTWLLQLLPSPDQPWQPGDAVLLDVSQKGKLLSVDACGQRYPALATRLQRQQPVDAGAAVLAVWRGLARTMVLAHQRRGESDQVASWLYQLLALDAAAPEWGHALQAASG